MNEPFGLRVTLPLAGLSTTVQAKVSPSTSVKLTVPVKSESSFPLAAPSAATGASLTEFTVISTEATFESTIPSLALKVKLSDPL